MHDHVGGRVEATLGCSHFAGDIVERFRGRLPIVLIGGDLERLDIGPGQQSIVVEHFFEVWYKPLTIRGVTRKPATDVIVHPAVPHGIQGLTHHLECVGIVETTIESHQQ